MTSRATAPHHDSRQLAGGNVGPFIQIGGTYPDSAAHPGRTEGRSLRDPFRRCVPSLSVVGEIR